MQMAVEQEKTEMEPLVRPLSDIAQYPDFVEEGDRSGSGELSEPNVYGEESDSCGEADETNESDDQPINERANLTEIIEDGDIDDISDNLTPKALTNSKDNKNVLMMAMEVACAYACVAIEDQSQRTAPANSMQRTITVINWKGKVILAVI